MLTFTLTVQPSMHVLYPEGIPWENMLTPQREAPANQKP